MRNVDRLVSLKHIRKIAWLGNYGNISECTGVNLNSRVQSMGIGPLDSIKIGHKYEINVCVALQIVTVRF